VSETDNPSPVAIETVLPEPGTVPANVTVPERGASTGSPGSPATSMPRCSPAAYGCEASKTKCWRTAPRTGQVQAPAVGAQTSAARVVATRKRRIENHLLSWTER
jgi:hypothetical protein